MERAILYHDNCQWDRSVTHIALIREDEHDFYGIPNDIVLHRLSLGRGITDIPLYEYSKHYWKILERRKY